MGIWWEFWLPMIPAGYIQRGFNVIILSLGDLGEHELFKGPKVQKSCSHFATEFFRELDSCHLMFLLQEVLLFHEQHLNGTAKTFEGSHPRLTSLNWGVINPQLQLFTRLSKLLWCTVHLLLKPSAGVQIFFSFSHAFSLHFSMSWRAYSSPQNFNCVCHHKQLWIFLYINK